MSEKSKNNENKKKKNVKVEEPKFEIGGYIGRLFGRQEEKRAKSHDGGRKRNKRSHRAEPTDHDDDGTQVENTDAKAKRKGGKRRTKRMDAAVTAVDDAPKNVPPGKVAMKEFVANTIKLGVQGILDEFNMIKAQTKNIDGIAKVAFDKHPDKNRYKDVYCIDADRVVLNYPLGTLNDYIHANWTGTGDGRRHICTQGPLPTTIDDFWSMVWQEKIKLIVMLCNCVENTKNKCEQYYPEYVDQEMKSGELSIKVTQKSDTPNRILTLTTMKITDGQEEFMLHHVQWVNWPDRGVPRETMTCLRLVQQFKRTSSPVLIHCSAGIGRTGTIVALDMLYTKLMKGDVVGFQEIVRELRSHRHGSVQTDVQYLYMHKVIIDIAIDRKVVTAEEVREFNEKYDEKCKL